MLGRPSAVHAADVLRGDGSCSNTAAVPIIYAHARHQLLLAGRVASVENATANGCGDRDEVPVDRRPVLFFFLTNTTGIGCGNVGISRERDFQVPVETVFWFP